MRRFTVGFETTEVAMRTGEYGLHVKRGKDTFFKGRITVRCDGCNGEGYLYRYGERWLCNSCAVEGC